MISLNSIRQDYEFIEAESSFLISKGYILRLNGDFSIVLSSEEFDIEIIYERYGDSTDFNVIPKKYGPKLPNGKSESFSVLWASDFDPEIPKQLKNKSRIDIIREGFWLLKSYPNKFFDINYLVNIKSKYNYYSI